MLNVARKQFAPGDNRGRRTGEVCTHRPMLIVTHSKCTLKVGVHTVPTGVNTTLIKIRREAHRNYSLATPRDIL